MVDGSGVGDDGLSASMDLQTAGDVLPAGLLELNDSSRAGISVHGVSSYSVTHRKGFLDNS